MCACEREGARGVYCVMYAQARDYQRFHSIIPCYIPLRQGPSLNLEPYWQPASPSNPVSVPPALSHEQMHDHYPISYVGTGNLI